MILFSIIGCLGITWDRLSLLNYWVFLCVHNLPVQHSHMMYESLRAFFTRPNKDWHLQNEWAHLRQARMVAEYISCFCILIMQLSKQEQSIFVNKFIHALKSKIHAKLELEDPRTLNEVFRLVDRYEAIVYRWIVNSEQNNYGANKSSFWVSRRRRRIDANWRAANKTKTP